MVAYRLALPTTAQLHDVFHVSKLKRCLGDPSVQHILFLATFKDGKPLYKPVKVLQSRIVLQSARSVCQYRDRFEN